MKELIPDVYRLENVGMSNVHALATGEGIALIDSGVAGLTDQIVEELEDEGYALSDLHTLILTHAHGDHIGSAAELARRSGAQVIAHREEAPYIQGERSLPADSFFKRVMNWVERRLMGGTSSFEVTRTVEGGETLEALGDLQVIHTPGHTPGSICLYRPEGKVLFSGDLLVNGNPMTGRGELQLSVPMFSVDMEQARASAQALVDLPIDVLCCGHGEPIADGAGEKIRALLT